MMTFIFIIFHTIFASLDQCTENSQSNNCKSIYNLEKEFIEAIDLIESQTSQISDFRGNEAVFLLGETGCGKSTIFNWLMGKKLKAVKSLEKLMPQWNSLIDVAQKDKYISAIGHSQDSQTSIPTIGKGQNGILFIDFPGWGDTRGWQYDLVNQYLSTRTLENYSKIKIVFICEQQYFETRRGNGLKEMISKINHFAQGTMLDKSAMLLITKVTFDDVNDQNWEEMKQLYISSVRQEFQKMLNQSTTVSQQSKTIIISLMQNDIYIMRKAGTQKQDFSINESLELLTQIGELESAPLKLMPNMTQTILNQFTIYFTQEFNNRKERVKMIIKGMKEVFEILIQGNTTKNQTIVLLQINKDIEQFQENISQFPLNQIMKYDALEAVYEKIMKMAKREIQKANNYANIQRVYNYFFSIRQHITAYQIQIFDDEQLSQLYKEQIRFGEQLKEKQLISSAEVKKMKMQIDQMEKVRLLQVEEMEKQQLQDKKRSGRLLRYLANEDRAWWKFWKPQRIPYNIPDEEVEDYILDGG